MSKRLTVSIILIATIIIATSSAFGQDPGEQDSLVFGNLDGSALQVMINYEISVPVYIKCDEDISFLHLCLATENDFIVQRNQFLPADVISEWPQYSTSPVEGWPEAAATSQSLVAIADYSLTEPNYINTNGEWQLLGEFVMQTTSNTDAMGQSCNLLPGEDPVEGVTVVFDDSFTPIVPSMRFSMLEFLEATPPVFTSPSPDTVINVNSYYPFSFVVDVVDENEDEIQLSVSCGYDDYELTEIEDIPGHAQYLFTWTPPVENDSIIPIIFTAVDEDNLSAELEINVNVEPVSITVTADTTFYSYPASLDVYLEISGDNAHVSSFNLVFLWDVTALSLSDVEFSADFADWEYLNNSIDPYGEGSLRLLGFANISGGDVSPKRYGTYHIATLNYQAADNIDLQGYAVNVDMPADSMADNVLADSTGYVVYHPQITPGYVYFTDLEGILIGDINLNQRAYETGDAVAFVDHLIDPVLYPFNATQSFASDCNQDGYRETVADLIYMLNVISGGTLAGSPVDINPPRLSLVESPTGLDLVIDDNTSVGGVLLTLNYLKKLNRDIAVSSDYKVYQNESDELLTLVIYPEQANDRLTGKIASLELDTGDIAAIAIDRAEFSTPQGALIR